MLSAGQVKQVNFLLNFNKISLKFLFSHLAEEVPGKVFLKDALLCDEVKEVLARLGALHHDDKGVVALKVVDKSDHRQHLVEFDRY